MPPINKNEWELWDDGKPNKKDPSYAGEVEDDVSNNEEVYFLMFHFIYAFYSICTCQLFQFAYVNYPNLNVQSLSQMTQFAYANNFNLHR